jgi:hypothetical protein
MTRRKTDTIASLPSEVTNVRHSRTREDPFSTVWEQVRQQIEENPGLGTYFSLSESAMMRHSGVMP